MLEVLAIEPYGGGSHLAFLRSWANHSRHRINSVSLPARHWKWRMRSAPLAMMPQLDSTIDPQKPPELVLVSDMLDLPTWIGFASRHRNFCEWIHDVPLVTYFHENQWAYPTATDARVDHHYGYSNLLTAAISDACWFNSQFNLTSFLDGSEAFLRRMPDCRDVPDLDAIREKSKVIAPGFVPPCNSSAGGQSHAKQDADQRIAIGWVGRFEHDKRPDRFADLLDRLHERGIAFELVLLGQRGRTCESLDRIVSDHNERIRFNGFASSREQYEHHLHEMDVVISTADHEFFGIAICEAIWAGAIPIVPNRLSYPELIPEDLRYDSLVQAVDKIETLATELPSRSDRATISKGCKDAIAGFQIDRTSARLDAEVMRVVSRKTN